MYFIHICTHLCSHLDNHSYAHLIRFNTYYLPFLTHKSFKKSSTDWPTHKRRNISHSSCTRHSPTHSAARSPTHTIILSLFPFPMHESLPYWATPAQPLTRPLTLPPKVTHPFPHPLTHSPTSVPLQPLTPPPRSPADTRPWRSPSNTSTRRTTTASWWPSPSSGPCRPPSGSRSSSSTSTTATRKVTRRSTTAPSSTPTSSSTRPYPPFISPASPWSTSTTEYLRWGHLCRACWCVGKVV